MKYAELKKRQEELSNELAKVTKMINDLDYEACGEKLEKAIHLLKEVLDFLPYPTLEVVCEECGVEFDLDLDYIIVELERLYGREFKKND